MEKELKSQIVQAAEAVKRKVKELRTMESYNEKMLDTVFQPITKPLRQIIRNNNHIEISKEPLNYNYNDDFDIKLDKDLNFESQNMNDKFKSSVREDISDEDIESLNVKNQNNTTLAQDDISDEYLDIESPEDTSNASFKTIESLVNSSMDDSSWSTSTEVFHDVPYGVRRERGKLMIGTSRVYIQNDKISIAGHEYTTTPGLLELLFKKVPNTDLITEIDYQAYKKILIETNAHRRDYDLNKPIKANRGQKYLRVIKPLFKLRKPSTSSVSSTVSTEKYVTEGEGLTLKKKIKENTDFIYWDDPNELVERLKLLIASKDAGNTGLDNEIISIIEELRESGIIN